MMLARNAGTIKHGFEKFETTAKRLDLETNDDKTKLIVNRLHPVKEICQKFLKQETTVLRKQIASNI
jgi:hypothetical protein